MSLEQSRCCFASPKSAPSPRRNALTTRQNVKSAAKALFSIVIPAQAGILNRLFIKDSRLLGNDNVKICRVASGMPVNT
jgi:hypothetical protein